MLGIDTPDSPDSLASGSDAVVRAVGGGAWGACVKVQRCSSGGDAPGRGARLRGCWAASVVARPVCAAPTTPAACVPSSTCRSRWRPKCSSATTARASASAPRCSTRRRRRSPRRQQTWRRRTAAQPPHLLGAELPVQRSFVVPPWPQPPSDTAATDENRRPPLAHPHASVLPPAPNTARGPRTPRNFIPQLCEPLFQTVLPCAAGALCVAARARRPAPSTRPPMARAGPISYRTHTSPPIFPHPSHPQFYRHPPASPPGGGGGACAPTAPAPPRRPCFRSLSHRATECNDTQAPRSSLPRSVTSSIPQPAPPWYHHLAPLVPPLARCMRVPLALPCPQSNARQAIAPLRPRAPHPPARRHLEPPPPPVFVPLWAPLLLAPLPRGPPFLICFLVAPLLPPSAHCAAVTHALPPPPPPPLLPCALTTHPPTRRTLLAFNEPPTLTGPSLLSTNQPDPSPLSPHTLFSFICRPPPLWVFWCVVPLPLHACVNSVHPRSQGWLAGRCRRQEGCLS